MPDGAMEKKTHAPQDIRNEMRLIADAGIVLRVSGDKLRVSASEKPPEGILLWLKQNKSSVIQELGKHKRDWEIIDGKYS